MSHGLVKPSIQAAASAPPPQPPHPPQPKTTASSSSSRTSLGGGGGGSEELRAWLTSFYTAKNPDKLGDIDFLVTKYIGIEGKLKSALVKRYGPLESASSPAEPPPRPPPPTQDAAEGERGSGAAETSLHHPNVTPAPPSTRPPQPPGLLLASLPSFLRNVITQNRWWRPKSSRGGQQRQRPVRGRISRGPATPTRSRAPHQVNKQGLNLDVSHVSP